jgi:large-conductance mechanosensitive channel
MTADEPTRARQRSNASFREYGCRIDRSVLDRIIALAKKDFSPKAHLNISTKRQSGGITSEISADSVEKLLDGLHESTAAGDPNWIDNLDIYVSDAGESFMRGREPRTVSISIDPDRVSARVAGEDAGWVRGRIGELNDIVKYSKVRWIISPVLHSSIAGAALALYVVAAAVLLGSQITHFKAIYAVLNFVLLALSVAFLLVSRKLTQRRRTQITILPTSPPARKDWMTISMLVVAILTLIATIAGVVYAIIQS